ncbi:MAG: molybdenum cofactor biosynthesis protein MoaE [Verrucomicrobiota bacterium]|jgi:molybdopterin synthase catalytic subunit
MLRHLSISSSPIDQAGPLQGCHIDAATGAVVCFTGIVRGDEEGRTIAALDYETFQKMAEYQFHLLFDQVEKQWPVKSIRLVHRIGRVPVGEASIWMEIAAPHREEAFAACQFVISEMKIRVPIWKKALS